LSWLFTELWGVFQPVLDHSANVEFFGRLANAATRYQARAAEGGSERDLLGAVVHEAHGILAELEEGTFEGPVVTSGGAVFDDAVTNKRAGAVALTA
jgi:hypothetical protein